MSREAQHLRPQTPARTDGQAHASPAQFDRGLLRGVQYLKDLHHPEPIKTVLQKVNECENEADAIFEEALTTLFKKEKNPIELIKIKEVYVALELATVKCEDAANVMESILIKNA